MVQDILSEKDVSVCITINDANATKLTRNEIQAYIDRGRDLNTNSKLIGIDIIVVSDEEVDVSYHYDARPFERIRRITGYLVGTLDRFNNGKRAEVEDRVTHSLADDCEDVYIGGGTDGNG